MATPERPGRFRKPPVPKSPATARSRFFRVYLQHAPTVAEFPLRGLRATARPHARLRTFVASARTIQKGAPRIRRATLPQALPEADSSHLRMQKLSVEWRKKSRASQTAGPPAPSHNRTRLSPSPMRVTIQRSFQFRPAAKTESGISMTPRATTNSEPARDFFEGSASIIRLRRRTELIAISDFPPPV